MSEEVEIKRGPGRPKSFNDKLAEKQESSAVRSSVEKRARRYREGDEQPDQFYISPDEIPDSFSVEWKRISIHNQADTKNVNHQYDQGWDFATVDQFPRFHWAAKDGETITIDGLALMIRPMELTEEARAEDYDKAISPIKGLPNKLRETPNGTMDRTAHRDIAPKIERTVERGSSRRNIAVE